MMSLAGGHRTGKTTLAEAYAAKFNATFVRSSASDVWRDFGLNPAVEPDFHTRTLIQDEILHRHEKLWRSVPAGVEAITDRSPLDFVAYLLADCSNNKVPESHEGWVEAYVHRCLGMVERFFSMIMLIQPGIPLVAAEGKAALSKAYIEHLNAILYGLVNDPKVKTIRFCMPRDVIDLDERVEMLRNCQVRTLDVVYTAKQESVGIGDVH
jgi:predicted ATPase